LTRPNLLLITPDQLRADCLGCYGHPSVGTRHLDRLAADGLRFERCYCAAPLCGPSRISFATSTYCSDHNHWDYGSTIDPGVPNLVTALKAAGYRTGMFGKNHLFTCAKLGQVWDELDEICLGNYDGHPAYTEAWSAFSLAPDHPFNITGRLTDETIDFVARAAANGRPFLAWVNYQDPHPAYTCPPPYDTLFDEHDVARAPSPRCADGAEPVRNQVWRAHSHMERCTDEDLRRAIAMYMGQVRYVDDSVGRLLGTLDRLSLADDTIVLFFSDHGELLGDHGMVHKLPAFYECLTRIPVLLRAPGLPPGVFRGLAEEVDLAPTLLDALGLPIPPTMSGRSWWSAIQAGDDRGRDTALCEAGGGAPTWREPIPGAHLLAPFLPTSLGPGAMLRRGDWKLTIYHDDAGELYNLADDPGEQINRYGDPACREARDALTLQLLKRRLGTRVRDAGQVLWPFERHPVDVRFEPLEHGL
jgi:arylsulfatase A-like enzyme